MPAKLQFEEEIDESLKIKLIQLKDAPALFHVVDRNRSYLRKWLPWLDQNQNVSEIEDFVRYASEEMDEGTEFTFAIWFEDEIVGVCSLQKVNFANRNAGIGYWISESYSNKGLAKKVTRHLLQIGFRNLKLHRIEIRCATGNLASQKVALGCGLKMEAVLRECEWLYDHFVDHQVYSILSTEY